MWVRKSASWSWFRLDDVHLAWQQRFPFFQGMMIVFIFYQSYYLIIFLMISLVFILTFTTSPFLLQIFFNLWVFSYFRPCTHTLLLFFFLEEFLLLSLNKIVYCMIHIILQISTLIFFFLNLISVFTCLFLTSVFPHFHFHFLFFEDWSRERFWFRTYRLCEHHELFQQYVLLCWKAESHED